ncbi:MAG: ferredoxin, partial [Verrucomicrobiia bacterium]
MKTSVELEKSAALQVATLMAAAARTAPKTRGIDNIKTLAIDDEPTRRKVVAKMREIAAKETRPSFAR